MPVSRSGARWLCLTGLAGLCLVALGVALWVPSGDPAVGTSRDRNDQTAVVYALSGTVGTSPVRMRLTRNGGTLTGSYRYEGPRPSVATAFSGLFLEGKVDGNGQATLTETSSDTAGKSAKTGSFRGTLTTGEAGTARFTGRWSSAQGSRELPFDLVQAIPTVRGSRIEPARWDAPQTGPAAAVTVAYPAIRDAGQGWASGFNRAVRDDVARVVAAFTENVAAIRPPSGVKPALEIDYEIAAANDDVVSIVYHEYADTGGAHPNANVRGLVFGVGTGRVVKLPDLFKPGSRYLPVLAKACQDALAPYPQLSSVDASASPGNYENFYLTPQGITIVFPVAHVLGDAVEVYVPYDTLRGELDPAGPAGNLVHRR